MNIIAHNNSQIIKNLAQDLGFLYCGISKSDFLSSEAPQLENWLKHNLNGKMAYMENHFDKRLDPRLLVEGSKSVISLLYNYFPSDQLLSQGDVKISKYAYGEDYHEVIKSKLSLFWAMIESKIGKIEGRMFVDSAPVLEKSWAKKSGLGWVGKHTNLINRKSGSFFFIAELIIDLDLQPDSSIGDFCGTCTKCIDACPTDAIYEPYKLDANKCISYLTIELKDNIPSEFQNQMQNWAFGCDICQDVCPWNRFSKPHNEPQFVTLDILKEKLDLKSIENMTEKTFESYFGKSAIKRTKLKGLKRNIEFISLLKPLE